MIDEREADDVRIWLATAETPDPRLDFAETVRTGQGLVRQRRVRRVAGTAALGLAVLVAVPGVIALASRDGVDTRPAEVGARCVYHPLPLPENAADHGLREAQVKLVDSDPTGRYAVGIANSPDTTVRLPVLWDNGVPRFLLAAADGDPIAVNERGQVLGRSWASNGRTRYRTWVYRDDALHDVALPPDAKYLDTYDISAAGDVLGHITYSIDEQGARAAIWPAADLTSPAELPNPPSGIALGHKFAANGAVLGERSPSRQAYLWNTQRVGVAPAEPATGVREANGDWAVGLADDGTTVHRWRLSTGRVTTVTLPVPEAFHASTATIRADGAVIALGAQENGRALVVRQDGPAELPAPPGTRPSPEHLNVDATRVYGAVVQGSRYDLDSRPAYWTC